MPLQKAIFDTVAYEQRLLEELLKTSYRTEGKLDALTGRVDKMEDRERSKAPRQNILREIATPREWSLALIVTVLAIWGVITPEDIRDMTRAALGLEPRVLHAPG